MQTHTEGDIWLRMQYYEFSASLDIVSKTVMVPLHPCLQSGLTKGADYVPVLVWLGAHVECNTYSI